MTADNGTLVNATIPTATTSRRDLTRRDSSSDDGYWTVFSGSGSYDPDDTNDRDAAIEGSYYLTYKLVSNDTSVYPQSVEDCFQFCDSVPECVYVNMYYEMNNHYWTMYSPNSQQLESGNTNYIQDSVAYAKSTGPIIGATPSGYTQVGSGPLPGANNAPSYLTFYFLAQFDFNACATLCNNLAADSNGNTCKYFNIWRAVVSDAPVTYTCSLYYDVPDISTADNYGDAQNNLVVTDSYGFAKN
ncbi:hypothetical protein BT96DRAFT_920457 [Gymnopus androsaceus JB14]|uniref:Uncharacterized protein n=1 Tax=Gymnopus androsaceus JB14 TaxID=1447944 RepID=A0A6A4HMZ6_9AGAR|nr:hypothetical protein BT96DRAFT_920457 [Gymnopus androsaceus JB14]